jgi:cyanophycinase
MSGVLALVGGGEFTPPCEALDRMLLAAAGGGPVLVLPTAAAFEHPARAVANAVAWFQSLGASAVGLDVLRRPDALDEANVEAVRSSRFVYLTGGNPMHLRSTLKDTPLFDALGIVLANGGVVAASSAGAMVLTDPMTDPRGGAFTIGLGLVAPMSVVPHAEQWKPDLLRRMLSLASHGVPVVSLTTGSAVVHRNGAWEAIGDVSVQLDGLAVGLTVLPA